MPLEIYFIFSITILRKGRKSLVLDFFTEIAEVTSNGFDYYFLINWPSNYKKITTSVKSVMYDSDDEVHAI